jgi:hypothetical protein
MKLEFSRQSLEKFSNIKYHENPSHGSQDVPCREKSRWIDRYNEADGRFPEFCESALKRFHIKILSNVRAVTAYSTGACCIIWDRYLLINIADVSTRIYRMLQYA